MKRIIYLPLTLLLFAGLVNANPVSKDVAQTVAANFYSRSFHSVKPTLSLSYTELDNNAQPLYYVLNINTNEGFVIIAAEDAAHPILAYSNKGPYVMPDKNNNVDWWMNCRKQEIAYARAGNVTADADIANEWTEYATNTFIQNHAPNAIQVVAPLVKSLWNQSPYYNATCPGGSVTGCVATAMAQIMRFWSYPSHGHGASAYWDEQVYGYQSSYGYLKAVYDTSHYVWADMPYSVNSNNAQVAKLMMDCGISVDMDYSPGSSGAWVITGDYPVCAQTSYVKYFGYNAATIKGVYKSNYTTANWILLIENELNSGRPVQYVGNDSINNEGHTWVCDGDSSNYFHMNWGWGGADNGYFSPVALNVLSYNFGWWDEAVIGIEPPPTSAFFHVSPTFGCSLVQAHFKDTSISTSPVTSWHWLFPGGNPSTSTDTNPVVDYSTPGTYNVTEIVSSKYGSDTIVRTSCISVAANAPLSSVTFETGTFPPSGWVNYNPNNTDYTWQLNSATGGYGKSTHCMYFNNAQAKNYFFTITTGLWVNNPPKAGMDVIGQTQRFYSPDFEFTKDTNPKIYFDVAYAPYNSVFSDTLDVYYSLDCGTTFTRVYSKGGMTLCTTGKSVVNGADTDKHGNFFPSNKTDWRTDTIYIPAIARAPGAMIAFENRSGNGSPIYIDNIMIPGTPADVPAVASAEPSVKVYPNPSTGTFNIDITNLSGVANMEIYNVLGQQIYTSQVKGSSEYMGQINLSSQPKGIYLYRVISENGSATSGRIVIE